MNKDTENAVKRVWGHRGLQLLQQDYESKVMHEIREKEAANARMMAQLKTAADQRELLSRAHRHVQSLATYLPPNHINFIEAKRNLELQQRKTEELGEITLEDSLLVQPQTVRGNTHRGGKKRRRLVNADIAVKTKAAFESLAKQNDLSKGRMRHLYDNRMLLYLDFDTAKEALADEKVLFHSHYAKKSKVATVDTVLPAAVKASAERLYLGRKKHKTYAPEILDAAKTPLGLDTKKPRAPLNEDELGDMVDRLTVEDLTKRMQRKQALELKTYGTVQPVRLSEAEIEESVSRQYDEEVDYRMQTRQTLDDTHYPVEDSNPFDEDDMLDHVKRVYYDSMQRTSEVAQQMEERLFKPDEKRQKKLTRRQMDECVSRNHDRFKEGNRGLP